MTTPSENRPPMALALEWVSKITVVALEMVLPGLAGHWLDGRYGTEFLAILGFLLGMTCGMWHLLTMTKVIKTNSSNDPNKEPPSERDSK